MNSLINHTIKLIIINPVSKWLLYIYSSLILITKNRDKNLQIGYMAKAINTKFGHYNKLYEHTYLENCEINDMTYIGKKTSLLNTKVGKFCSIGHNCEIGLGKHPVNNFVSTHPAFFSKNKQCGLTFTKKNYFEEYDAIEIGNDVWIGSNSIILDGITIHDGAIIAAGSVVTKDVKPYSIVSGVPAKEIRKRFTVDQIETLNNTKWWNTRLEELKLNHKRFHDINKFLDEQ